MDKKQVDYLAQLARLELSEQEKTHLQGQLGSILDYVQELETLNTKEVYPTLHPFVSGTVWREDVAREKKDTSSILDIAPETEKNHFKVKKVIE